MKYKKTVSVGAFAKKGEDIRDGDIITIANEGKQVEGQFGTQDVFLVKLTNGEEKNINVNQTSINGLVDAFGEDSISWVGKQVKVWLIKQNVAGKFTNVLYISHPSADLTESGFVMKKQQMKKKVAPAAVEEEPIDDIGEEIDADEEYDAL